MSKFVVATPGRSVCDDNARVLAQCDSLRFIALGTRRGTAGVPLELTRLNPAIGLCTYAAAKVLSPFHAESFRFRLLPWFDRWVKRQLVPGDHVISSYGYTNESFVSARSHGGKTFVDCGNSHPQNFWDVLVEEHRRWSCVQPPVSRWWIDRSLSMLQHVDYLLCPSQYVRESFLARGFKPEQILRNVYPVDVSCFTPATRTRPASRPLTLINTGQLSLRKGTPYLLEAFRLLRQKHPSARLLLTQSIHDNVKPVLAHYRDLPIEWAPGLPHPALAARLLEADVFVLPSLEEGFVRTAAEAMACGLPVVVTAHTGVNDLVRPGVNGQVVPIRDAKAIARAVEQCFERRLAEGPLPVAHLQEQLSFQRFAAEFLAQLRALDLLS